VNERQPHYPRCAHRTYHMTCEQFEALLVRAASRCELCGASAWPGRVHDFIRHERFELFMDHDHRLGFRAVRGLVCPSCNGVMMRVDAGLREPSPEIRAYLDNPWYLAAGIDPNGCPADCRYGSHKRAYARAAA